MSSLPLLVGLLEDPVGGVVRDTVRAGELPDPVPGEQSGGRQRGTPAHQDL
jgi:hypothetical protein